jgi:hypothetical protein
MGVLNCLYTTVSAQNSSYWTEIGDTLYTNHDVTNKAKKRQQH